MYETQAQLCDAYLASGQAPEARVIAEDLVAREPWEQAHIERFRRALLMLRIGDPDTVIAERLSGQVPFVATDRFAEEVDQAGEIEASDRPGGPGASENEATPAPVRPSEDSEATPTLTQVREATQEVDMAA
jgi:hypothetical protein